MCCLLLFLELRADLPLRGARAQHQRGGRFPRVGPHLRSEDNAANVEGNPLYVDVSFLIKEPPG